MKTHVIKRPVIGISASLLTIETGCFRGRERAYVGQDYIKAIHQAGAIPMILPIISGNEAIWQQLTLIDGLLLSGGYDVHPHFYGEEPDRLLQDIYPARDEYEIKLVHYADQMGKPILGICRGLQLLNVAFGGSLYQDVSYYTSSVLKHSQQAGVEVSSHSVEILEGTKLKTILEKPAILTNSFHHQAIKQLAPGWQMNARTKDGLIEGAEKMGDSFVLGVQWHPELMIEKRSDIFRLFLYFVARAAERMER
ncbi:gamma-glutamyl-gamma-aminobutyrate hydrolase family protein [Candidatus Protochlamydia phocaeensis]|uniref:gamma-glutamyl-gamma-aminobutyrate hydrolase family protein n=1 Tax=Candidatus Protochlamydia phocaeensis TaxID=1414722 RepID=UPI000837E240|nr:gamma-glutamyl-gamma-aminobutyrate hydrolase family protein [Candidatus Protochlamydia phocaeensis]